MPQEIPPLDGAPTPEQISLPPWFETVMWVAVILAAVWLASTIFIVMRRRATNLTSAQQAGVRKDATPDFMKVDHKAREEAMKRGEAYDEKLVEREKAEAAAAAGADDKKKPIGLLQTIAGVASFLFSLFSLVSMLLGTFTQVERMNGQLSKAGNMQEIWAGIMKYPIPTIICLFVIVYTLYIWISKKKWAEPPKI